MATEYLEYNVKITYKQILLGVVINDLMSSR